MATGPLPGLIQDLRRTAILRGGAWPTDEQLLTDYLCRRDEAALTALVRRHAPMVWGVCRRVLGRRHDAEDAFQATFLVLVRRAATIAAPELLANWLYGVAHQTARKARATAALRRTRERPVTDVPEPAAAEHDPSTDLRPLLDGELTCLPDGYRAVVVLCDLEGKTRSEAARALGVPEGTVGSRLARARVLLAKRLSRRGIALPGGALAAAVSPSATAAGMPGPSVASAIKAATLVAAGHAATAGAVPARVAALTEEVLNAMLVSKLKAVVAAVLLLGIVATGIAALARHTPAAPGEPRPKSPGPGPAARPAPAARPPLPTGPNRILFWRDGYLTLIDPDGANEKRVSEDRGEFNPETATLSPDGKTLAVLVLKQPPVGRREPERVLLYARGVGEEEPGTDLGVECRTFCWSPDGTALACTALTEGPDNKPPVATHFRLDVRTKERAALALPADHVITDWSRDGRYFLTTRLWVGPKGPSARLYLMNRDGSEHRALTPADRQAAFGRLSPGGGRVLYTTPNPVPAGDWEAGDRLCVLDLATGRTAPVADAPRSGTVTGFCWSPDGRRIGYTWREVHPGKFEDVKHRETWSHLVVCDPDGKNVKTLASEKGDGPAVLTIGSVDWR